MSSGVIILIEYVIKTKDVKFKQLSKQSFHLYFLAVLLSLEQRKRVSLEAGELE